MTARTQPPAGWSVELLGLIAAVRFDNGDRQLLWCDGRWSIERRDQRGRAMSVPALSVPRATSMDEARRVGCAWLHEIESS